MPLPELKGTLTDIGTEELNHLEMIGAIVYQLTKDLTEDEIKEQGGNAAYGRGAPAKQCGGDAHGGVLHEMLQALPQGGYVDAVAWEAVLQ